MKWSFPHIHSHHNKSFFLYIKKYKEEQCAKLIRESRGAMLRTYQLTDQIMTDDETKSGPEESSEEETEEAGEEGAE